MDHKWIGPYKVVKDIGKGFYSIQGVDNGKKSARVHGIHLKPYKTPSETPESDKQDPLNESHLDLLQVHESSHDNHLSNDISSLASSISKADAVDNEDEVLSQDGHINYIKSPSNNKSMLQQSSIASPEAYEHADFSNNVNECDNAFVASDMSNHRSNSTDLEIHDSNHCDQFICITLFEGYGYFPLFVPVYPKTLLKVSPIKHMPFQSNKSGGTYVANWTLHERKIYLICVCRYIYMYAYVCHNIHARKITSYAAS